MSYDDLQELQVKFQTYEMLVSKTMVMDARLY